MSVDLSRYDFDEYRYDRPRALHAAIAYNRETNKPVAEVNIVAGQEHAVSDPALIEQDYRVQAQYAKPGQQLSLPIANFPAKVSYALANREGRAVAAPHVLIAGLSARLGHQPVADEYLTEEGSRMSRSAARRGLIKPHPSNPRMEANSEFSGDDKPSELDVNASLAESSRGYLEAERAGVFRTDTFSDEEVHQAARQVFRDRRRTPPAAPTGQQRRLF